MKIDIETLLDIEPGISVELDAEGSYIYLSPEDAMDFRLYDATNGRVYHFAYLDEAIDQYNFRRGFKS